MSDERCPWHGRGCTYVSRRGFLQGSAALLAAAPLLAGCSSPGYEQAGAPPIRPCGPAAKCTPSLWAAFVRREGPYGMLWPGAVYDGEAARRMYAAKVADTARQLGAHLNLRPEPIHSLAEGQAWVAQAEAAQADGLVLVMLDRQEHAWPTARKVAQSKIPSIVYSPLGTSFTTNTIDLADAPGCVVYSTDDFRQAAYGMKMLCAAAKMRRTCCVVIKGDRRYDAVLGDTGITLRHVPAAAFIEEYNRTPDSAEIVAMADEYMRCARRRISATRQDVVNGLKSYYVAGRFLEREGGDAITMDCLGALGQSPVSLPCIAWSRMNDDGIPAACEADYGAVASLVMVHYLFDRPGFQQDPVADTADDTIIGAHCSCPTRLNGYREPPEPFDIRHHHGNRDAVPRTLWRKGQRVTSVDLLPGRDGGAGDEARSTVLIAAGTVVENKDVPPSGGCVVSVKVKFDGGQEVLNWPGFHQIFFYGDYQEQVRDFCQLCNFKAQVGSMITSTEQNKLLVRRYIEEVVNTGNVEGLAEFIASDYTEVHNDVRYPMGLEGAKEHILGGRRTYEDLHLTIKQQIAEGDWVVTRATARGTHRGGWLGTKPTGKTVAFTVVNVDKVVGGRIVEHGGAANMLEPLLEAGAIRVVGPGE